MTLPYDAMPLDARRASFGWFGEPTADCFDETGRLTEEMRIAVPIGETCILCATPIEADHSGRAMPYASAAGPRIVYAHRECRLRSVLGSPEHLDGHCSCNGGAPAESGLSYREEALIVWERAIATRGDHDG